MTCCGRDDGLRGAFSVRQDAEAYRDQYLSGSGVGPACGHERTATVVDAPADMETLAPISGFGTYLLTRPSPWSRAHKV
jgi:hypothetical protein